MTEPSPPDAGALTRYAATDVIFIAQDGFRQPSARVRCYNFARALRQEGLRAEVLSFYDHLGANDQAGALSAIPEEEKLRLSLEAHRILAGNPRAVVVVQKVGYHALAAVLAAARGGNPIILDYDDYELDMSPYRRLEPWIPSLQPADFLRIIANRAAACIVSSHRLLDILTPLNPNTHLIHTVADQELFSPAGREQPRARFGDTVNVLYSGDFWGDIPLKDLVFALDAFALVPRAVRRRARFHVVGFGRAWEEAKARIRERFPDVPEIALHEFIPPAEFGGVLREMDIGVLPYSINAFNEAKSPTKMFEYILAKVAVCATPVGEAARCLEPGVHGLFASGVEDYARALTRLIDDAGERQRIAAAAHALALQRYSLQGIAARLTAVVRDAMAKGAGMDRNAATAAPREVTLEQHLTAVLGRTRPIAPREVHLVRSDLRALLALRDAATADPRRWSAPLLAALDWPGLSCVDGIEPDRVRALKDTGARCRPAARLRAAVRLPPRPRPPGPPALSKLAAAEDWDDAGWWRWATRVRTNVSSFRPAYADAQDTARLNEEDVKNNVCNFFKRTHGTWERAQYLYALDRLGILATPPRVLVASADVDGFPLLMTEFADEVAVIDIGPRRAEHAARVAAGDFDPWLAKPRRVRRDRIAIHHAALADVPIAATADHDAAILPQNTLLRCDAGALLAWIDARLRPGGVVLFSTDVHLNDGTDVPGLPAGCAADGGLPALFAAHTGWEPTGPFDASLSDATLDRFVVTGDADAANPHFVARTGATLHMRAVWVFRKRDATPAGGWSTLAAALSALAWSVLA